MKHSGDGGKKPQTSSEVIIRRPIVLVGGMRTVTHHAADQSPRTTPSRSLGKGTPDLFGHRRKEKDAESKTRS